MVRLSSQSKSMLWSTVAAYSATGMWTRPKLMAPFHRTRGAGTLDVDMTTILRPATVGRPAGVACRNAALRVVRP